MKLGNLKYRQGSDCCSFDSRNTEVKLIILFIIYKWVSPGTSRVEVQVFRSTCSILVVSAGFQSCETETQMSQAPGLLWNNSPSLSEIEDICHSRQILMPQLAVEWICIKFSNHPWIQRFCLVLYREYFSFSGKKESPRGGWKDKQC